MKLHTGSAMLALGLMGLLSGTSMAAPLLTAGVQDLSGVLVTRGNMFTLVVGSDGFAAERIPVTGDRAALAKLAAVAVAPREEGASYADCATCWVHGELSYGFAGWLFVADAVKPGLDAARLAAAKDAFRAALTRTPSDKVAAALTVLERAHVLDAALEEALNARASSR